MPREAVPQLKLALLIGVEEYAHELYGTLPNVARDVGRLEQRLQQAGFQTKSLLANCSTCCTG